MKLFNRISKHHTKLQGEVRIRRKIVINKKCKNRFSSFSAKEFQIALLTTTQNFKYKFEFSKFKDRFYSFFCMRLFNRIAKHHTHFQGEVPIRRKIKRNKKMEN